MMTVYENGAYPETCYLGFTHAAAWMSGYTRVSRRSIALTAALNGRGLTGALNDRSVVVQLNDRSIEAESRYN
jgi:hypothetical protein